MRSPAGHSSHPPFSRQARLGILLSIFVPAVTLMLIWPSISGASARTLQSEGSESSFLRLDSSLLSNRSGRPLVKEPQADSGLQIASNAKIDMYLHMGGTSYKLETSGTTLRDGLAKAGIFPKPSDLFKPNLDSPLQEGLHAYLKESIPLVVYADGAVDSTFTLRSTAGQALADLGIGLQGMDRVEPGLETIITGPTALRITRVSEEILTEEEVVPFETVREASNDMEIRTQAVAQEGEDGLFKRSIRILYEDGQEVSRTPDREWMETEPTTRVILYGTKTIWRTVDTASGLVEYRDKLRMLATSYDASGGGKPRSSPAYGITATGMRAGRGIVAVDPRVIPLYTRLYIPGYGLAVAGDTGGGVIGNLIDLGFEEGDTGLWAAHWVDVYILR